MASTLQLMPGQAPPIAIITPTDQRGILWIVSALCLVTATLSLLIRAYVRVEFSHSYGHDDISILGSFLLFVIQSALVIFAVKKGVGETIRDVTPDDLLSLQKAYYASNLCYIITLWIAKCSVILLLLRLTAKTKNAFVTKIILGVTAVLGLASLLIAALDCSLGSPWIFIGKHCTGDGAHWIAIAILDIITEVAIIVTVCFLINNVQLMGTKKLTIIAGFSFRLLMLPLIILRLYYVLSGVHSSDPTLRLDYVVYNTQIEISLAIVAATVPCLRPFMNATNTSFLGQVSTGMGSGYHKNDYGSNEKTRSKTPIGSALRSLRTGRSQKDTSTQRSQDEIALTPMGRGDIIGKVSESGPNERQEDQLSHGSQDSQTGIIRRDLEWHVRYEDRSNANTRRRQDDYDGQYAYAR